MEIMVPLSRYKIRTCPWSKDMEAYTGREIFVREKVAEKLFFINENLSAGVGISNKKLRRKKLELVVAYGYRYPEIQKKYFYEQLKSEELKSLQKGKNLSQTALYGIVHNLIAVPDVAGHPTGGAVDVTIYADDVPLDMGTEIAEFGKPKLLPTYSNLITKKQLQNRLLLREHMLFKTGDEGGFAPFNGEWWHFSYGDKEWAYWNRVKKSLYQQVEFPFKM